MQTYGGFGSRTRSVYEVYGIGPTDNIDVYRL